MSGTHAHSAGATAAFVRKEMVQPAPPPMAETGIVKWLRENLFSSIPNSIMTLIALYVIYLLLSLFVPWVMNGVWGSAEAGPNSLDECRQRLEGATGGCFAVIRERWQQLLFGNYPKDELWRPTVAFFGLVLAALPVMFVKLPSILRVFTLVFPFVAYWLLWGGTLWAPALFFGAVIVGFLAYQKLVANAFFLGILGFFAVLILSGMFLIGPMASTINGIIPIELSNVESREIGGFILNFILGITCVSLSLPLGIMLALGRQSDLPIIKGICVVFIEFIRGVPLITLLFVASVMLAYFLPPDANFDIMIRVIIMITLFASAYIAEAIRGGLAALPKGQYEAGDSLGLDYWQSMRLIILPQALKISIPSIVNIAIGLFKDTTLVSIISMVDMLGMIKLRIFNTTEWFGIYWELLGFAALLFFIICYGISQYSQWLERQLATDHR